MDPTGPASPLAHGVIVHAISAEPGAPHARARRACQNTYVVRLPLRACVRPATPPPRDFQRGIPFHRVLTTSSRTGGRAGGRPPRAHNFDRPAHEYIDPPTHTIGLGCWALASSFCHKTLLAFPTHYWTRLLGASFTILSQNAVCLTPLTGQSAGRPIGQAESVLRYPGMDILTCVILTCIYM